MAHLLSVLTALMCDRLSQRIASCANDEFFALDHGLQGHPQAEEPSGDQTPTLLLGRSWAEKPGVSRTPGQPFTRKLFGRRGKCSRHFPIKHAGWYGPIQSNTSSRICFNVSPTSAPQVTRALSMGHPDERALPSVEMTTPSFFSMLHLTSPGRYWPHGFTRPNITTVLDYDASRFHSSCGL